MLASVACARRLGRESYGAVGILVATMANFSAVAGFGLGTTASNYVARLRGTSPERLANIIALCSFGAAGSGCLYLVAIVAFAPLLAKSLLANPALATPLALAAISIPFAALSAVVIGIFNGFERFSRTAYINIIAGILGAATTLLALRMGGVTAATLGLLSSFVYSAVLGAWLFKRERNRPTLRFTWRGMMRERSVIWHFSLPSLLSSVTSMAVWFCYTLLARQPNGYSSMGLYSAADRYRAVLVFVPAAFGTTLLPMFSNIRAEDPNQLKRNLVKSLLLSMTAVAVPAILVAGFAGRFMSVFGSSFTEGKVVLLWLALAAVFEVANNILGVFVIVSRSMWVRFYLDVLLGGVMVGGGLLLIPRFGATGLAMTYTAGLAAAVAAISIIVWRELTQAV